MAWKLTEVPDEPEQPNGCLMAIGVIVMIIIALIMVANS